MKLATDAFESSTGHDLSFYDEFSSGRIVSRITTDTQDFGQLVTIVTDVTSQVIEAVVLGVVLWRIDWRLTLIILAFLPLIFFFGILFRKLARRVTQQGMRAMANVNSTIKETVSGIAVAKNFRQEPSIFATFNEANQTSYQVNVRRGIGALDGLPDPKCHGRDGDRAAGLRRRADRAQGMSQQGHGTCSSSAWTALCSRS